MADTQENILDNLSATKINLSQEEIVLFWKFNKFQNKYPEGFSNQKLIDFKNILDQK